VSAGVGAVWTNQVEGELEGGSERAWTMLRQAVGSERQGMNNSQRMAKRVWTASER